MSGFDYKTRNSGLPYLSGQAPSYDNLDLPLPFNTMNMGAPQPDASMGYAQNWPGGGIQPYNIDEEAEFLNRQTPADFTPPSTSGTGPGMAYGTAPAAWQSSAHTMADSSPFSLGGAVMGGLGAAYNAVAPAVAGAGRFLADQTFGTNYGVAHAAEAERAKATPTYTASPNSPAMAGLGGAARGMSALDAASARNAYRQAHAGDADRASATSERAASNQLLLDTLERNDQKRADEQQRHERQASLPGYTEFRGDNSEAGSLMYKSDGPRTDSAFGQSYKRPKAGGTFSQSPMGGRAQWQDEQRVATEDARTLFERNAIEERAQDPLGTRAKLAQAQAVQARIQIVNQSFFDAKAQLDAGLAAGKITPERYQSSLTDLQQERLLGHEEADPKGGYERALTPPDPFR